MNTKAIGAAVTGARHLRTQRNGQDAVATWARGDAACVVVCDGCGSGGSSEVGARLGARLVAAAIAAHIEHGLDRDLDHGLGACMAAARAEVARAIGALIERMPGEPVDALHEYFLFTVIAAASVGGDAIVYAIGDGAYAIDGRTRVLGPFADNRPPYLGYDLTGDAPRARIERATCEAIVVATDGAEALDLADFTAARFATHPDALRRHLAVLAHTAERVDWDARRVVRVPAVLQDDCAIGILRVAP